MPKSSRLSSVLRFFRHVAPEHDAHDARHALRFPKVDAPYARRMGAASARSADAAARRRDGRHRRRAAGDVAGNVLPPRRLADLVEIVVALVGEELLAQLEAAALARDGVAHARILPSATDWMAAMIGSYPVQRQILPPMASTISSRVRPRVLLEQGARAHQHACGAIAALGGEMVHERDLQRVQLRPVGHAGHGAHRLAATSSASVRQESTVRPRPPPCRPRTRPGAAVFGRQVAAAAAQEVEQVLPGSAKAARSWPFSVNATGVFMRPAPVFREAAQVDAATLAPVPCRRQRIRRRVEPFGRLRRGARNRRRVERLTVERPLRARAAHRRRPHRAEGDAQRRACGLPLAARARPWRSPRRPWLDPADLGEG